MPTPLSNLNTERSRIEDKIRECELLLLRIDEERSRCAIQVAERKLMEQLLVSRQPNPRARSHNLTRWTDKSARRRSAGPLG